MSFQFTLRLVLIVLQNVSFALLVGALITRSWLIDVQSEPILRCVRHLNRTAWLSSLTTLLSSIGVLWIHCATVTRVELMVGWAAIPSVLMETAFGFAWLAGTASMLVVLASQFVRPQTQRASTAVVYLCVGGTALARSNVSHAVEAGQLSFRVWVDFLHLMSISVWAGVVMVTATFLFPTLLRAHNSDSRLSVSLLQSLSNSATVALVVLLASGAYNAWRNVDTPLNLVGTAYGTLLLVKLAFVLLAVSLGAYARTMVMPEIVALAKSMKHHEHAIWLRRLHRILILESTILFAVFFVAALLVSSALP
jgi:copper resistance protein D